MSTSTVRPAPVDTAELTRKVQEMYRRVAEAPGEKYHFEMGRALAERLGYPPDALDSVPEEALESFAGVGYFFDLAALVAGETVVDLGSGSGTDAFVAARQVSAAGLVVGVDFTPAQLAKARRLAAGAGLDHVRFDESTIDELALRSGCADCVISNGVVNLAPDKGRVFAEAARVLRPGGRLALADIVTEQELTQSIVCNTDLWASCIGGAAQVDTYRAAVEAAGLEVEEIRPNPYAFISDQAAGASARFGVKSISLLARKPSD